jgi:hypothetical protein
MKYEFGAFKNGATGISAEGEEVNFVKGSDFAMFMKVNFTCEEGFSNQLLYKQDGKIWGGFKGGDPRDIVSLKD